MLFPEKASFILSDEHFLFFSSQSNEVYGIIILILYKKKVRSRTKIMASSPITSWKIDGETVDDFIFGLQNHCRWQLQP